MPIDFRKLHAAHTELLFDAVKNQADLLLAATDPLMKDVEKEFKKVGVDDEYADALSDEYYSLEQIKYETIPLILMRINSIAEAILYNIASRTTGKKIEKGISTHKCVVCRLEGVGIKLDIIPNHQKFQFMRKLCNCYKHNNGYIDKPELVAKLSQEMNEKIKWEKIDPFEYLESTHEYIKDIINKMPSG